MKGGRSAIYIAILILIVTGFFFYNYIVKIYESAVEVEPKNLFADSQSTVTISVIPLNALGWKAFLRKSPAEFKIIEGNTLVEIVKLDKENGILILKAKSETGKVVIRIETKYSLLPMMAEIMIEPNLT